MFYLPILRFCVGTPNHLTGAMYLTPVSERNWHSNSLLTNMLW